MSRVHTWAHLNNRQLAALDRSNTIVLLPLGHTQQFGPHLPHGTTSLAVAEIAKQTADLLTMTDRVCHVAILPPLHYGADPAERHQPDRFVNSSSPALRADTLKAVITDIASGVARGGFRFLFSVGHHAGPDHCRAVQKGLDRVCKDYPGFIAEDTFSYLYAGEAANAAPDLGTLTSRRVSPIEQAAVEVHGHGGTTDTAIMLALNPSLVDPGYMGLQGIAEDMAAQQADWPGYYGGAPAMAEADLGRAAISQQAYRTTWLIRQALSGDGMAGLKRFPGY